MDQMERAAKIVNETSRAVDLVEAAEKANAAHEECLRHRGQSTKSAAEAGEILSEVRDRLAKTKGNKGGWERRVEQRCHFSLRTAQVYIKVFKTLQAVGQGAELCALLSVNQLLGYSPKSDGRENPPEADPGDGDFLDEFAEDLRPRLIRWAKTRRRFSEQTKDLMSLMTSPSDRRLLGELIAATLQLLQGLCPSRDEAHQVDLVVRAIEMPALPAPSPLSV
ncbi:MAG: hypothetical protein U0790_04090 [Isosphaeraceae bacterium]